MSKAFLITSISVHGRRYIYSPAEIIGEGSSSIAFRAYLLDDSGSNRAKTISSFKQEENSLLVIKRSKAALPERKFSRIHHEAQLLQIVQEHPNFVRYVDHSGQSSSPYLITQFVPQTLESLLSQEQLGQEKVWDYLQQIPLALEKFQDAGLAHCDLKCSNIGYDEKAREIKVLDFGSCLPYAHDKPTRITRRRGCPYFPPEFEKGILTPTSDTYMAGKVLEWMLTGCSGKTVQDTLEYIEIAHPLTPPPSFEKVVHGMLHPDWKQRLPVPKLKAAIDQAWKEMHDQEYFQPLEYGTIRIDTGLSWLWESPTEMN